MHSGPYTRKYPTTEDLRNAWFVPCEGMVIPENFEQEMVERISNALGLHSRRGTAGHGMPPCDW